MCNNFELSDLFACNGICGKFIVSMFVVHFYNCIIYLPFVFNIHKTTWVHYLLFISVFALVQIVNNCETCVLE